MFASVVQLDERIEFEAGAISRNEAKGKGLGETRGLPGFVDPPEVDPFREENEDSLPGAGVPTKQLSEADKRMLDIILELIKELETDRINWAISIWHATSKPYITTILTITDLCYRWRLF